MEAFFQHQGFCSKMGVFPLKGELTSKNFICLFDRGALKKYNCQRNFDKTFYKYPKIDIDVLILTHFHSYGRRHLQCENETKMTSPRRDDQKQHEYGSEHKQRFTH